MREETAAPSWLMARGSINENKLGTVLQNKHYIIYQDKAFFSPEGKLTEDAVRNLIYQELREYVHSGIGAKVESVLSALKLVAAQECLKDNPAEDVFSIPVANGTYSLVDSFRPYKSLTRYRLPVAYNPEAPEPKKWLSFLSQLLHEEDIPTLQEFMGYCLIPSTIGQKMLLITGKGGEGKSRIGVVMKALLGNNMNLGSIAKVEKSPFARADLQHKLLMVDDDLKLEALDQTNYLKSIITAELPMDLEKKGIQSYQGKLYVRFMAFGNGSLQALHDRSNGFFRRQILLEAKEREPGRKDDPFLAMGLVGEAEGILLWCIQGLERLIANDFRFTQSKRARENLLRSIYQANNILEFLRSKGYIAFDPEGSASSRALYSIYQDWCGDNALKPLSANSFWNYLMQNQEQYHLTPCKHLNAGNGRQVRGFKGIRVLPRF